MVELVPVPVVVIAPGDRVRVQVPAAGRPFRTTLPVATAQVGWVMVPIAGAVGVAGCGLMTTLADATEVHPEIPSVTVYVYVPVGNKVMVELIPVPVEVIAPGERVSVQVPAAGSPFSTTLPVATAQVGWVMVPIAGADGVNGCGLITTLADAGEVHPDMPSVTV